MNDHMQIEKWTQRLLALDTGLVSDVLDEAGLPGRTLSPAITSAVTSKKTAGPVVCVKGGKVTKGAHATPALPPAQLEHGISKGSVLVLASGGMVEAAPIGGIIARSLQAHGCNGIVTDAAIRDRQEIEEIGLPVYASGFSPANAARIWQFETIGEPIVMPAAGGGTLAIALGDFIIADLDGAVVIPRHCIQQIIEDAEKLQQIETSIVAAIERGATRAEAFTLFPRFAHIRAATKLCGT